MQYEEVEIHFKFIVKRGAKECCHNLKEVVARYRVDNTMCILDTQIKEIIKEPLKND